MSWRHTGLFDICKLIQHARHALINLKSVSEISPKFPRNLPQPDTPHSVSSYISTVASYFTCSFLSVLLFSRVRCPSLRDINSFGWSLSYFRSYRYLSSLRKETETSWTWCRRKIYYSPNIWDGWCLSWASERFSTCSRVHCFSYGEIVFDVMCTVVTCQYTYIEAIFRSMFELWDDCSWSNIFGSGYNYSNYQSDSFYNSLLYSQNIFLFTIVLYICELIYILYHYISYIIYKNLLCIASGSVSLLYRRQSIFTRDIHLNIRHVSCVIIWWVILPNMSHVKLTRLNHPQHHLTDHLLHHIRIRYTVHDGPSTLVLLHLFILMAVDHDPDRWALENKREGVVL